ncbi:MAG: hypothetical protein WCP06_05480 [Verrucomicrobiota bacterium]
MARQIRLLIPSTLIAIGLALGVASNAQEAVSGTSVASVTASPIATPATSATPAPTAAIPSPVKAKGDHPDQAAFLDSLNPAQRRRFAENFERWKNLPPTKQAELRKHEQIRIKQMLKEVNEAIEQNGLKLSQEQRQLFTYRFAQERRTIEENLRKEMDEKRGQAVEQLISELVAEFGTMPPFLNYSTPAATETPKP